MTQTMSQLKMVPGETRINLMDFKKNDRCTFR